MNKGFCLKEKYGKDWFCSCEKCAKNSSSKEKSPEYNWRETRMIKHGNKKKLDDEHNSMNDMITSW